MHPFFPIYIINEIVHVTLKISIEKRRKKENKLQSMQTPDRDEVS